MQVPEPGSCRLYRYCLELRRRLSLDDLQLDRGHLHLASTATPSCRCALDAVRETASDSDSPWSRFLRRVITEKVLILQGMQNSDWTDKQDFQPDSLVWLSVVPP